MDFKARAKELVSKMTLEEKVSQMNYDSPAIKRLGIPAYNWWNEGLHGVARSGSATVFPQAIGMAASFDTDMMLEVANVISDEARAKYNEYKKFGYTDIYQGLTYWSPNINIFRDPRWGRGHETYGEDPYLTGKMGVAFIKGLQGDGKYRKLDATIKHFAVHSGPEADRHHFDAIVSEKDLYETYLEAFRYCIEKAKPSAAMGAYNRFNGEACCGSPYVLIDLLKKELGFDGYIVSDCGAVFDLHKNHKVTANEKESAALAVKSGCDLNHGNIYNALLEAVKEGLISEETVTESAERLFEARFRLGMFDDDCEYDNIPYDIVECEKHTDLNRRVAAKSMVLLKNDGILPLKNVKTIAVVGPNADKKDVLLGNYNGLPSRYTTLLRGIQDGTDAKVIYARGSHEYKDHAALHYTEEKPLNEAIIAAKHADAVIVCVGINPSMEGEESSATYGGWGSKGDKNTIDLPKCQTDLIKAIVEVGKPTILVNVSGSCINLSLADESCNAVIQCFYPGAEGGNALADIIFGRVSPSARLPVSFYKSVDELPPFEDYNMENRTYKFFRGKCVYDFGHGLTYSKITEKYIDDYTVELYNEGDYDTDYSVLKFEYVPHKTLTAFKCVHIKKGERMTVKLERD